jgi:hypothetical protein
MFLYMADASMLFVGGFPVGTTAQRLRDIFGHSTG